MAVEGWRTPCAGRSLPRLDSAPQVEQLCRAVLHTLHPTPRREQPKTTEAGPARSAQYQRPAWSMLNRCRGSLLPLVPLAETPAGVSAPLRGAASLRLRRSLVSLGPWHSPKSSTTWTISPRVAAAALFVFSGFHPEPRGRFTGRLRRLPRCAGHRGPAWKALLRVAPAWCHSPTRNLPALILASGTRWSRAERSFLFDQLATSLAIAADTTAAAIGVSATRSGFGRHSGLRNSRTRRSPIRRRNRASGSVFRHEIVARASHVLSAPPRLSAGCQYGK